MEKLSIYKAARTIKKRDNSLYNALRSIYEDSVFVGEIAQLWPELPLLANLRCGLWYAPKFHSNCYFKSTDGHTNNWSFNTSRLNLHVALLAGQKGGCMIIDSTRKGKRFPDSMSKTIPIWTCVLNRAIANYRMRHCAAGNSEVKVSDASIDVSVDIRRNISGWDCSLHLPLWVSDTERALIESRLEGWTNDLETCGADIASLASCLKKPLRPLWISQRTVIWLNEVPEYDSWDFTPIILVSASASTFSFHQRTTSEFSWNYIPGAGDDEESWARGLSPELFWKYSYDIISSGPNLCNQKVADIVEKDRVYRSQRGEEAPQLSIKQRAVHYSVEEVSCSTISRGDGDHKESSLSDSAVCWLGSTNIAVGASQSVTEVSGVDSILNCSKDPVPLWHKDPETYLHLPIVGSKFDRFSLVRHLPSALKFSKMTLQRGKALLICCNDGEDISICACLAILAALFNDRGEFDDGKYFSGRRHISKPELRRKLVFISKFAVNARPSRGNLKQVFNYLNCGKLETEVLVV